MYSHQKNFEKAFKWTKDLRSRYLHTLAVFRIYERFRKLAAPNVVGKKKATKNVKTLSNHLYFFSPLQEAARCYFFIELAKFFDEDKWKQSLTIKHILDFTEKNLSSFYNEEFLKYHSERKFIPELFEGYKPLIPQDVKKIRKRLQRNKKLIGNLKKYRDKFLAHDDLKKDEIKITGLQIKTLLKIIQSTVDLYYLKLDFSSNIYSNYDEEPVWAVDRVINALHEHEDGRMQKIKKKYNL
ncbi:hypothetical protein HZA40_03260 [Candidatus Peregrinibacteria bacterium]|nr:hypothetical protein [Candidatus Peregrinibacteria bacterium]